MRLFNTVRARRALQLVSQRHLPIRSTRRSDDLPYTVYEGHNLTSTYITDMVFTLANIAERFKSGEVYNIAGQSYHDIKTASDLILKAAGKTDKLVTYSEGEPFTTMHKKVDGSKAVRDLGHVPKGRPGRGNRQRR